MAWGPAGLVWLGLNLGFGDVTCTPTTGEVTFTGNVPVVEEQTGGLQPHPLVWLGLNLQQVAGHPSPSTGTVTFTGNKPGVDPGGYDLTPGTGAVAFTGNVPIATTTAFVLPTTGTVTFTGNVPGIGTAITFNVVNHDLPGWWYADVGHAARFAFMPVGIRLANRDNVATYDIAPTTGEIIFAGQVAEVFTDVTSQPTTGEVEFTGEIATVSADATLFPTTGVVTFVGEIPQINTESLAQPVTGEITFTGYAPGVDAESTVSPETGLIEFLSQTPSVDIQEQQYTPTEGVIVFYGNEAGIDGAVDTADLGRKKDGGLILRGKKKRPLLVRIDDEEFVVETVEEAEALLAQAKDVYKQQVNDLSMQLLDKASTPTLEIKPVRMPRIRAEGPPGPDLDALIKEVAEMRAEIRGLYERAAAAQKKYVNDDDEALALLL